MIVIIRFESNGKKIINRESYVNISPPTTKELLDRYGGLYPNLKNFEVERIDKSKEKEEDKDEEFERIKEIIKKYGSTYILKKLGKLDEYLSLNGKNLRDKDVELLEIIYNTYKWVQFELEERVR